KSTLFSVPDCQAIVKKAVVERLKTKYKMDWFPETGAVYKIQVAILRDTATLTIDTTGAGLHKRGYRELTSKAPIKETLAAGMLELSFWKPHRQLVDPMCGSGTIAIEGAMAAKNIAPGLGRSFVSETWEQIDRKIWQTAQEEAKSAVFTGEIAPIHASDIDPQVILQAKDGAAKAGVADLINFSVMDINKVNVTGDFGVLMTNPPYGQRIGKKGDLLKIYNHLARLVPKNSNWGAYIITSDEEFPTHFGRKPDARRKLFNGATKVEFYQYHGPKPPRR
ncbi:MAG: class I SAM-dependent RNA methyltransferase, partial [Defluviitaleaceae bacterium]|nr:class I SAM-dependent RNA methyltransferase [Defluviitaleaceae bacterium]